MSFPRGSMALLAAFALLAGGVSADEVKLRHNPKAGYRKTGPVRILRLKSRAAPQQKLKGEPKYASAKPIYFELKLGPRQAPHTVVLDESKGTGHGYDRLYADANGDGDLSDEKAVAGSAGRQPRHDTALFMRAQILVDYGGQKAPWHFAAYSATPRPRKESDGTVLAIRPVGCYEGELTLDGKRLKIAVVDADANGCFNDPPGTQKAASGDGPPQAVGDRVLIDLNGDGRFDVRRSEAFPCSKRLFVKGAYYQMAVAPSGQTLAWGLTKVAMGSLARDGGGVFKLKLVSPENGTVAVESKGDPVKVPVGTHKIAACTIELKDEIGTIWKGAGKGTPECKEIVITEGKTATAKFGPPLLIGVTARVVPEGSIEAVKPGETLRLNLKVSGQSGERYRASALRSGRGRPAPPALKITGPDGEVVATGSFRYG